MNNPMRYFFLNCLIMALFSFSSSIEATESENWKEFHSISGNCKIMFPEFPQHVKQHIPLSEDSISLEYDAYIAKEGPKSVYMMLIASYPMQIEEDKIEASMEGFLNGILNHNQSNQLIFADLTRINGRKAMDFFVKSGGLFFKGRAMVAENRLYLITVECDAKCYNDESFECFINSFELSNE